MENIFSRIVERRNTSSYKWDFCKELTGYKNLLPMWLADMDFHSPPEIIEAIKKRADHGVFGYTVTPASYYEAFIQWVKARYSWDIKREWITVVPDVLRAIVFTIHAYTNLGDKVVIQPPVYYPFKKLILNNGRQVIENQLIFDGKQYFMDYEQLEELIDSRTKMLILCNPHNPIGRSWTLEELRKLSEICSCHDILVVSDEIHSDLVFEGYQHIPFAKISTQSGSMTITCNSPSKTFNLSGCCIANVIIENEELLTSYHNICESLWTKMTNIFSILAAETGYRNCESWLEEVLQYIYGNYLLLKNYLDAEIPSIEVVELQATYLAWIDFRNTGLKSEKINRLLREEAEVWLDEGKIFGAGGELFQRMNIACPRTALQESLSRIKRTFGKF